MSTIIDRMMGSMKQTGKPRPDPCTVDLSRYPPSTHAAIRAVCDEQRERERQERAEISRDVDEDDAP